MDVLWDMARMVSICSFWEESRGERGMIRNERVITGMGCGWWRTQGCFFGSSWQVSIMGAVCCEFNIIVQASSIAKKISLIIKVSSLQRHLQT